MLDPRDGLVGIDRWPGKFTGNEAQQPRGDGPLGAMETGQENAISLANPVGHHCAVRQFERERTANQSETSSSAPEFEFSVT